MLKQILIIPLLLESTTYVFLGFVCLFVLAIQWISSFISNESLFGIEKTTNSIYLVFYLATLTNFHIDSWVFPIICKKNNLLFNIYTDYLIFCYIS